MRTNIEIDDELMDAALRATGLETKRAAVEEGLRLLIKLRRQRDMDKLFGKLKWDGDLEYSRLGRGTDVDDNRQEQPVKTQNGFTPDDIARELRTSPKNVRRMLRARDIRVGKGRRHNFDRATFDWLCRTLRDRT